MGVRGARRGAKLFMALATTALLLLLPVDFLQHAVHELRMAWARGGNMGASGEYGVIGGMLLADSPAVSFNFEAHSQLWAWVKEDRLKSGPASAPITHNITEEHIAAIGFNWRGYLLRNPDLRQQGIRTPVAAYRHFVEIGQSLGRRHDRIPLLMRYSACQGLFNQMYAHLAAVMLADKLDADIVLPPSLYRTSFNQHFSVDQRLNEVRWIPAPINHLLDVDHLRAYFGARGRSVYLTPRAAPLPDCNKPADAFPLYIHPNTLDVQVTALDGVYQSSQPLASLWDAAANAVLTHHHAMRQQGYPEDAAVILDLPSTFFSVMTANSLQAAEDAAGAIRFNKTVVHMAQHVLRAMNIRRSGFNGVHLRLETDASEWLKNFGGADKYLAEYVAAMTRAGLGIASSHSSGTRSREVTAAQDATVASSAQGSGRQAQASGGDAAAGASSDAGAGAEEAQAADDSGSGDDLPGSTTGSTASRTAGSTRTSKPDAALDLYIASGMLAYAPDEEKEVLFEFLKPYAARILYKEMFLSKERLATLNTEQQALLDFLVLAESRTFVGLGSSTFSVFLREYRKLNGHTGKRSNVFVKSAAIKTDVLFQRTSRFFAGKPSVSSTGAGSPVSERTDL